MSINFFDIHSGTYQSTFFWPKRFLKTQIFENKGNLSSEENILAYFFSFHRTWKMSWNILYGYTRYVDFYCPKDKITSLGPKRSIEINISKKNCFHDEKEFLALFHRIIECHKHQGTNYKGPQAILTITQILWKIKELFLGPRRLLRTQSCEKQGNLSSEEKTLASFFSFHRTWKMTKNTI